MKTHQQCLYCGREIEGTQVCGCDKSRINWMTPKEFNDKLIGVLPNSKWRYEYTPKPDINPLFLQDLLFLAKELPKIEFLNHEEQVIANYKKGNWKAVGDYVLFVQQLHAILYPNKPLYRKVLDYVADCFTKVKLYLKTIV